MDYCGFAEHARLKADNQKYHKLLNDAHVAMGELQLKIQQLELVIEKHNEICTMDNAKELPLRPVEGESDAVE